MYEAMEVVTIIPWHCLVLTHNRMFIFCHLGAHLNSKSGVKLYWDLCIDAW